MRVLFIVSNMRQGDADYILPLGVAYLASVLEQEGVSVEVLDLDVNPISNQHVEEHINFGKYDCVCLGFVSARFPIIKDLLLSVRNACTSSKAKMVLGGYGVSAIPKFMLEETGADFIICGEGEQAIKYLIGKLKSKEPVERIISRPYIEDLDTIPHPSWHLFDMDTYSFPRVRFYDGVGKIGFVSSSRGCIGKCTFCYRMCKGYRTRTVDSIISEIRFLHYAYGIDSIFFLDEMAFHSTKRINELLDAIANLPFDIRWNTSTRVEVLQDKDSVKRMKDGGCVNIGVGFESMDDAVLKAIGKRTTAEQNRIAMENCFEVGLNVSINMLWNMPNDTVDSLWKGVDFILKYSFWNECRTIKPITPYPGCPLYYTAIRDGKLSGPEDFYNKFVNLDRITVNFTELTEEVMYEELYKANNVLVDAYIKNGGRGDATEMKLAFYNLFFNDFTEFRGVR